MKHPKQDNFVKSIAAMLEPREKEARLSLWCYSTEEECARVRAAFAARRSKVQKMTCLSIEEQVLLNVDLQPHHCPDTTTFKCVGHLHYEIDTRPHEDRRQALAGSIKELLANDQPGAVVLELNKTGMQGLLAAVDKGCNEYDKSLIKPRIAEALGISVEPATSLVSEQAVEPQTSDGDIDQVEASDSLPVSLPSMGEIQPMRASRRMVVLLVVVAVFAVLALLLL